MIDLAEAGYDARISGPLAVGYTEPGRPAEFATAAAPDAEQLGVDQVACISSAGKQVTAACAGMLVLDGVLDPQAPIRDWIPELPRWADPIRIEHLVHHTAGWPDEHIRELGFSGAVPVWDNDSLLALACELPGLLAEPGESFSYSSIGYICLAIIAERAAGEPMPAMAQRRIFGPLGLTATRFWTGPQPHPPTVTSHPAWFDGLPYAQTVGDGGVWSSVRDLARWSDALAINAFGDELAGLLRRPGRLNDGTVVDYAWGSFIMRGEHGVAYGHGGWWPGCSTFVIQAPHSGRSAALIAFTEDGGVTQTLGRRLVGI